MKPITTGRATIKSRLRMLVAGLLCTMVMVLLGILVRGGVPHVDSWILGFQAGPSTLLGGIGKAASGLLVLGCAATLIVVTVLGTIRADLRAAPLILPYLAVLALCLGGALLDDLFRRPGPPMQAADWSYPSGHATVVTAIAFTALLMSSELLPGWRAALSGLLGVTVLLTSAFRVLMAEHYLTDVVGAIVGTVGVGLIAAALFKLPRRSSGAGQLP